MLGALTQHVMCGGATQVRRPMCLASRGRVPASGGVGATRANSNHSFVGGSCNTKTISKHMECTRAEPEGDLDGSQCMTYDEIVLGQNYTAKVVRIVSFGIFVSYGAERHALVHISEIVDAFVEDIHEYLAVGDEIVIRIINKDPNTGKIAGSIKQSGVPLPGFVGSD